MSAGFAARCDVCQNVFVMANVPAWANHPEYPEGVDLEPIACPYCGEGPFALRDDVTSLTDAVIEFALEERQGG